MKMLYTNYDIKTIAKNITPLDFKNIIAEIIKENGQNAENVILNFKQILDNYKISY